MRTSAFPALICLVAAATAFLMLPLSAADPVVPDGVIFEKGIEFANPDNQHLQLDLARPAKGDGPFPNDEQATWIVERLQASGVEASLLTLEGAGHGFQGADAQKAHDAMLDFFERHLKP